MCEIHGGIFCLCLSPEFVTVTEKNVIVLSGELS